MEEYTIEYDLLQQLKFTLNCGNEALAIRMIEQFAFTIREKMYNEEDIRESFIAGVDKESYNGVNFDEWFEQFKKEKGL